MARHPFPLVDLLIGVPNPARLGVPALLAHGTVVELFADLACTTPLDARAADAAGALTSTPISSVTVNGVTIPRFYGPDSESLAVVYGRASGASGNGFELRRADGLPPAGAALDRNNAINLAPLEWFSKFRILADATDSATWPNRWSVSYVPPGGVGEHLTAWFNEFGEFRGTPAKLDTIPFRIFAGDLPADWTARSKGVSLLEVVSDRTNRTNIFKVDGNGNVTTAGTVTATNIGVKIAGVLNAGQAPPNGTPAGTIYLVRP